MRLKKKRKILDFRISGFQVHILAKLLPIAQLHAELIFLH